MFNNNPRYIVWITIYLWYLLEGMSAKLPVVSTRHKILQHVAQLSMQLFSSVLSYVLYPTCCISVQPFSIPHVWNCVPHTGGMSVSIAWPEWIIFPNSTLTCYTSQELFVLSTETSQCSPDGKDITLLWYVDGWGCITRCYKFRAHH